MFFICNFKRTIVFLYKKTEIEFLGKFTSKLKLLLLKQTLKNTI